MHDFLNRWRIAKLLLKNNNSTVYIQNLTERDKVDLAAGRWLNFKLWYAPEFVVKMTPDDESILSQVTLVAAHKSRTKGIVDTFRPNGDDHLEATRLKVLHIQTCHSNSMLLKDYLAWLTKEQM